MFRGLRLICSDHKSRCRGKETALTVSKWHTARAQFFILLMASWISGCSTAPSVSPQELNKPKGPEMAVFKGDLDTVWKAVRKAMSGYPLKRDDQSVGIMETDSMPGTDMWMPPFRDKDIKSTKYTLRVVAQKGFLKNKPITRVKVDKQSTFKRDFFTGDKPIESDRFEEKIILYRIGRELDIDNYITKNVGTSGFVESESAAAPKELDGAVEMNAKPDSNAELNPEDNASFSN